MPLQKDPVDSEPQKTEQPAEEELFSGEFEEEQELDLDDYFGDPDGGDNVTDHGTPRPTDEPEDGEPEDTLVEEPEDVEPDPEDAEAVAAAAKAAADAELQEEPPAPETVKIKVQGEELELTHDQLVEMAQKGEDYTRKTQALSEREKRLTGYEGLINLAQNDPNFRQYLQTYNPVAPQAAPAKEEPVDDTPPEDPVERVKWEAKKEAMKEMAPVIDGLRQELETVKQSVTQVAPELKRSVDPLGKVTHDAMLGYLESLPPAAAKALYTKWDTDAEAYEEGYKWMRENVETQMKKHGERGAEDAPDPAATTKVEPKAKAKPDKVTRKVVKKAPVLESAGAAEIESNQADKSKQIKTLQNRIKNQEYDPRDVGALFDLMDPID